MFIILASGAVSTFARRSARGSAVGPAPHLSVSSQDAGVVMLLLVGLADPWPHRIVSALLAVRQRRRDWCCNGNGRPRTCGVVGPERVVCLKSSGCENDQITEMALTSAKLHGSEHFKGLSWTQWTNLAVRMPTCIGRSLCPARPEHTWSDPELFLNTSF
jgi:hypothetical protein